MGLTGTTWRFKDTPSMAAFTATTATASSNFFTFNGVAGKYIYFNKSRSDTPIFYFGNASDDRTLVYDETHGWKDPGYKVITFTGEPSSFSASEAAFLQILRANAERVPNTTYIVGDLDLTDIANAIRAKTGKSALLQFPYDFVDDILDIEGSGIDVGDTTASASDVRTGKYFYNSSGVKTQGSIADQAAQTITPGTTDQEITAGKYLAGKQTIKGDSNLVAGNIKSGVTIFGVTGSHSGGTNVSDTTATASDVRSGKYFYNSSGTKTQGSLSNGSVVENAPTVNNDTGVVTGTATVTGGYVTSDTKSNTLQLSTQDAQTIHPSTTDQEIAKGKFTTGKQTIKGVLVSGLSAGNIKSGVTVKIGDSTDDDCVMSVTGTGEIGGYTIENLFPYSGETDGTVTNVSQRITLKALPNETPNTTAIENAIIAGITEYNDTLKKGATLIVSALYAVLYMAASEYNYTFCISDITCNREGVYSYKKDYIEANSSSERFQLLTPSITWSTS